MISRLQWQPGSDTETGDVDELVLRLGTGKETRAVCAMARSDVQEMVATLSLWLAELPIPARLYEGQFVREVEQ